MNAFCNLAEERLRSEARRGAIVVVGIVDIVRVELDLVVVEVEVRSLTELVIAIIGKFAFIHPCSLEIEVYLCVSRIYPLNPVFYSTVSL
jgi:hypothetical protein